LQLLTASSQGWSDETLYNKLQEITWDATAGIRDSRHKSQTIPLTMQHFMRDTLANWTLSAVNVLDNGGNSCRRRRICDVGTGTGVLMQFLKDFAVMNGMNDFDESDVTGIDLSLQMIKIAQVNCPRAQFIQSDFLKHVPATPYDVIVMNECLHNFRNLTLAFEHVSSDAVLAPGGRLIISNPRGYSNVVKQFGANRWLAPSLLPSRQELAVFARNHNLSIALEPDIKSVHYLAVLDKAIKHIV